MADTPEMTASEGTTLVAGATDSSEQSGAGEGAGEDAGGDAGETAPDYSAQRTEVERAQADAVIQTELEASRRARGHISEHARRLAAVEQKLEAAGQANSGVSAEQWNALVDSLREMLPDGAPERLRINTDARAQDARVAALEAELERLKNPQEPTADAEPDEHPEVARIRSGWEAAYTQVTGYAQGKGLDAAEIPGEADWKAVFDKSPADPAGGMEAVMRLVEERAAAKARRADRADAASGGPTKAAPRKGGLTREMMKTMTAEQLMQYPREERNAALMAP